MVRHRSTNAHWVNDTLKPEAGMRPGVHGLLVALLLTGATLAAHGWALTDGLFLDDHWHRLRLQDDNWSLRSLLEATTIKPDRFIDAWWQEKPIQWQYLRPFAVLVAKSVYHLSGGSVKAWHAISVALHLINAFLVHRLCLWLTRRRFWSLVGALLFVVYSHSVYAVGWLAAQNIILQTTLLLTALLCYIKASGLDVFAAPADDGTDGTQDTEGGSVFSTGSFLKRTAAIVCRKLPLVGKTGNKLPRSLERNRQQVASVLEKQTDRGPVRPLGKYLFACTLVCWCLALLSRENAIMLPIFLAAFDLSFGGRRHLRARAPVYVLLVILGVAFLLWRLVFFYSPMPEFYMRRPDGPGYVWWSLAKLMHYYTAAVWLSPLTVGPSGRFNPFLAVPWDCALMFAILAILGTGYYLACRRARGYWIWPLWILLAVLPVVPVVATPHSGYLPSVGFAVGMILGPALRDRIRPISFGRWSPGVAIWFLIATTIYMPIYRPMWSSFLAAERGTIQRVVCDPPPQAASDLFFINLPFVNIYAQLHLRHAWGLDPDTNPRGPGGVGTASLGPVSDCLGQVPASFDPNMLSAGPSSDFRCHVLTYAPDVLRMDQPCRLEQLDAYSFSLSIEGRPYFGGALGRFLIEGMRDNGRLRTGDVIAGELFDVTIERADERGVGRLTFRFREPLTSERYCFYMGTRECSAARLRFRAPGDPPATGVPEVAVSGVNQESPGPILRDEEHFARLRWRRDRLFRIRSIAARIIRTDLYLTGPPFPGPK